MKTNNKVTFVYWVSISVGKPTAICSALYMHVAPFALIIFFELWFVPWLVFSLLVYLAAVFVSSRNAPPQQTAVRWGGALRDETKTAANETSQLKTSPPFLEASRKRTRERAINPLALASPSHFAHAWLLATTPNGELARWLVCSLQKCSLKIKKSWTKVPCLGWNYPFQTFRAWPLVSEITSSLKPLQGLYTP